MPDGSDDSREQGIEFGALADDLEEESYPLAHERLLDRYGDRELELADGSTTLREVLGSEEGTENEYEDAESVRQAIFNMVGGGAIGRDEYSDRGGNAPDSDDSSETESL